MKVILDTNFLMAVSQFKIDVFEQLRGHDIYVINTVVDELKEQSNGRSKDAKAAQLSLLLIDNKGLKVLRTNEKKADTSLIIYSKRGYVIATQDRELREMVKKAGGKSIYIRQRKYVII
ncbi:MAG: hypothetical protein KJ906_03195 [Nanoarchaeota archaeon]|nr:hypothetical protein [Nanoarchaeota archaeon]